jgi:hypothetical protein
MQVDRGGYLMFVTALAIGGAGGYVASEADLVPHMKKPAPPPPPPAPSATPAVASAPPPVVSAAPAVDAGPSCDDSVGEPEACPPIGLPTVEGGCGSFASDRCKDFKQQMKPRVAAAAIACLNKLPYGAQCDPKRVDLCAHQALMNACEDKAPACDSIVKTCATASVSECRLAMSGLKEMGRETLVECTKKHCADRGIVGCEAQTPGT